VTTLNSYKVLLIVGSDTVCRNRSDCWYVRSTIINTVSGLSYVGGRTSSQEAVRRLRTELFTEQRGSRDFVPHVAVLITDGLSDNWQQTNEEVMADTRSAVLCFIMYLISNLCEDL